MNNSRNMHHLEQLKKILEEMSDKDISKVISHMAMQYSDETSQTVSFVFWICFMAEHDLNIALQGGWALSKKANPEFNHVEVDKVIREDHKIKSEKIDPENKDFNKREITFGDLIYIKERLFGKTNFVKLLWKLKKLRDDLSHGRISELKYNDQNLLLRATKESLLIDYFTLVSEQEDSLDISPIWQKLREEDKKDIETKFNQMMHG